MLRSTLSTLRPKALLRASALVAVGGLVIGGMPAVAFAADGTVSVVSTNGQGGVSSASNSASATVIVTTSEAFVYNALTSTAPTVTFSRHDATTDAIVGTVTAGSGGVTPGTAQTFTVTVDFTSANPTAGGAHDYDIDVVGAVIGSPSHDDACTNCYTVLSGPPLVSSATPTHIAQGGVATLAVLGTNFAKGNFPAPNSNYGTVAGSPKIEVRPHGSGTAAANITLSDPTTGNPPVPAPIAATSTSIGKRITVGAAVATGAYDIYVENTDGQNDTLDNAITVDAGMGITTVDPATRGQASSGGTITITGHDFASDIAGTISAATGQTNGVTYTFSRTSSSEVKFTNVAVASNATVAGRTITLSSAAESQTITSTAFSVTAAPVPSTLSLGDSSLGRYGRGATAVHVTITGSGFTNGNNAAGTQLVFSPATGITATAQATTNSSTATATIDIAGNAPTGTVTVSVINPDGGTASCSSACTFTIGAAPAITGVSPGSEGRGQTSDVTLTGTNLANSSSPTAPTVTIGHATHGAVTNVNATSWKVAAVHADADTTGAQDILLVNGDDKGRTTCTGCFVISSLAVTGPSSGSAFNDHTVSVVVTGAGFDPTATVAMVKTGTGIGTVPSIAGVITSAPTESSAGAADGTSLTASFNLAGVDPGTYAFRVTNPALTPFPGVGQGGQYTVVTNAPTITTVSPSSRGAGAINQTVTITGTGFGPNAAVTFSNAAVHADSVTRNSATQITVVLHIDADVAADSAGTVTVTNTDNQAKSSPFTIVVGPHISSVTPVRRGQGAADTTFTVTGTHASFPTSAHASLTFVGGSGVSVGTITVTPGAAGTPPVIPAGDDTLTATLTVTGGATVGAYDVVLVDTSTGGRSVLASGFTVDVKPAVTSVASANPDGGAVGTSVPVTITGTGFRPNPTLTFTSGVTASNVLQTSATTITATLAIPAGATRDSFIDVTVTNDDGGFGSKSNAFHLYGKPDAPTTVTATPGNAKATVSWAAPGFDGGSAVTSYTVTASPGGATATVSAPATSTDVTGLTNGTAYTFTVHATNAAGNGAESAASAATTPRTVPGKPTGVTGAPVNGGANVSWTAPASTGGSAITGYTVTASPGGATKTVSGSQTSASVSGLTNGTAYTFAVHATNVAGDGAESDPSAAVTPRTVPGAPTNVAGTPGNGKATVSWTAPTSDGGNAITSYVVTATPGPATATVNGATTSTDVTGLTNGTAYTFTVHAVNAAGPGAESAPSAAVTPRTVPAKPTNVSASPGDSSAVVSWTAPTDTGGSAITGYTVTASPGGATASVGGSQTSATVTGLDNGTAYRFTVHATNVAGDGAESDQTSQVTPVGKATAPSQVVATPGNGKATVSWAVPADDNGSPITGYTVTSTPGNHTATVSAPATTTDVTGLTNGTAYTFTVHATNAVGDGPESDPSNSVTPRTVPGAPTGVTATAGNASAVVGWTAPANGGSAITGYTVTATPGGATATAGGSATSATVTGLTNGTSYTFTVHATNVAGDGAESSASSAVTPSTKPGAPTAVTATPGDTKATVSWTAPSSTGGAAITGYTVTSSPGNVTKAVDGSTTTTDVTGLTNGTAYTFTVHATNVSGDSPESSASAAVTPRTTPGAPTNVTAVDGNQSENVSWTAPVSNGGSAITGYTVTVTPGGGTTDTQGATSAVVTGLTNGTAYTFTVHATNVAGDGPESAASSPATPATVPGKATAVHATAGNGQASVSWTAPADNGGATITSYTATASPGGKTGTVTGSPAATSVTVTGLTNGVTYTFTVVATNRIGAGAASDPSSPLPLTTGPGVPVEKEFFLNDLDGDGNHGLYLRSTPTGAATALIPDDTVNGTVDVYDLSTSRDGSRATYILDTYASDGTPLREKVVVRDVSGRQVRVLDDLSLSGSAFDFEPQLSPDGKTAVWTQFGLTMLVKKVAVGSGTPTTLVSGYGLPTYLSSSTLLVQRATDGKAYTLPAAGGSVTAAVGFPLGLDNLAVSPDGTHVAWALFSSLTAAKVQSATLALSGSTATASAVVDLATNQLNHEPSFSRDGATLYFLHDSGGGGDIWSGPADASSPAAVVAPSTGTDELDVAIAATDDGTLPGAASSLPAVLNGTSATVRWTLPADPDLSGVLITRKLGSTVQRSNVYVPAPTTSFVDTGLTLGSTYTYSLMAIDRTGRTSSTVTRSVTAVAAKPTLTSPTSSGTTKTPFSVRFAASAPSSVHFTVDYRANTTTTWTHWVSGVAGVARTFGSAATTGVAKTTSVAGATYRFRVMATDAYGNATPFVSSAAAVVPYDQSKATFSSGTTVSSTAAWLGSYRDLSKTGATAKVTLVGSQLYIIGRRCSTCGVMDIYEGSKLLKSVDTRSSSTINRSMLFSVAYSTIGTHTYTVKVRGTSGRPHVMLDAWGMRR